MNDIRTLNALRGLKLRAPFGPIADKFGPADKTSVSPPAPDGSTLVNYVWSRGELSIAALTWRTAAGEHVWGVRLFGAGRIDPELGFGVGASRDAVESRCPDAGALDGDSIRVPLHDGVLTIDFADDLVREIQLLAPLIA